MEKNKDIISRLKELIEKNEEILIKGDLSDIGNYIGMAVGPYVEIGAFGFEADDLYSGIEHGVDLAKNYPEYVKLGDKR